MNRNYLMVILVLVAAMVSCQKEPFETNDLSDLSTKSAQILLDEITVENAVEEVNYESAFYSFAENSLWGLFQGGTKWGWKGSLRYKIGQCPDVNIEREEGGYPRTITLNYGDSTVLRNGKVMSGKVIIYISSPPNTDGFIKDVTYENFSVDNVSVGGNSTFTFAGDNQTESKHTLTSDLTITLVDGTVLHREEEKVREWVSGLDTELDQTDDTIKVTGFVQVVVGDTLNYRKEITNPLIKSGECRYFIEGIVDFYENGVLFASIDYGDGICDNSAMLTKDGETVEVELSGKEPKINSGNQYGNGNENKQNKGENGNHGEGNNAGGNGNGKGNSGGNGN